MRLLHTFLLLLSLVFSTLTAEEYKYSYIPKTAYENQIFPITIIGIGTGSQKAPRFLFDQRGSNQPLFDQPLIVKNGDDSFYTFYFRAKGVDFLLPPLQITDENTSVDLDGASFPISRLKPREDYCGVLAADMKIKTSQASTFDEKNNLVTIMIEAYEANLENMHLTNTLEDGIDNIEREFAKVVGEFYAVVPDSQKKFKFTYFNTIKQQYVFLQVPIEIKDVTTAAAHAELNPTDDSYDKLKKDAFIALSVLFLLLFLWKRDFFYLVIAAVLVITLLTFYTPKENLCIKQGASLYILPTPTSRISTKVDEQYTTPLLGQHAEYNKIKYQNGTIGWVKNEDLCKN